jgi:hypothetical protein
VKTVLFACTHNAGRSQMAAALFNALADPSKARAESAGTQPGDRRCLGPRCPRSAGEPSEGERKHRDSPDGQSDAGCIAQPVAQGDGLFEEDE